jgi:leucyl-tRNA synthetase
MFHGILIGIAIATALIVAAEIKFDYSLGDWLKDRTLSLLGRFQTYEHAKAATLKAKAARLEHKAEAVKAQIASKMKKLEFWK